MLPRLIDQRSRQQLPRIELGYREPLEPRLLPACEAVKLCAVAVPRTEIDPIRTALTEDERGHTA